MSTYILLKDWLVPGLSGNIVRAGTKFLKLSERAYQGGDGGWIFDKTVVEDSAFFKKEEKQCFIPEFKCANGYSCNEQFAVNLLHKKGYRIYPANPLATKFTDMLYTETDLRKAFHSSRVQKMRIDGSLRPEYSTFEDYLKTIKP